jgi:hypothetical protein
LFELCSACILNGSSRVCQDCYHILSSEL